MSAASAESVENGLPMTRSAIFFNSPRGISAQKVGRTENGSDAYADATSRSRKTLIYAVDLIKPSR